jgi:pyoverdine/dityrosine biosynthesis protein Dit1
MDILLELTWPFPRCITILANNEDVYIQLHILCKHIATFINVYTPLRVLLPVYPVGAELLIIVSTGRDNDTLAMLCQF